MASNQYAINQFRKGLAGKGSTMWSSGDKLYSYYTVILQRTPTKELIGNITRYSVTTSKHQSKAGIRQAQFLTTRVPWGAADLIPYLLDNTKFLRKQQ